MKILYEYKKIFEELRNEENEYYIKLFQGDFENNYPFGFLFGKLTDKDERILEKIHDINNNKVLDINFQNFIVSLEVAKNKRERIQLFQKVKEYESLNIRDYASIQKMEFIDTYVNEISFSKIVKYYRSIHDPINSETNIFNCTGDEYVAFSFFQLLYEYYNQSLVRFDVPDNNNLEKLYSRNGMDLLSTDVQYNKYRLLTIDDNFDISSSNIPKVYDKRIGSYILTKEIPLKLLQFLKMLRKQRLVKSLALRPEYSLAGENFIDLSIALEELERGEIFTLSNLGIPSITKLYSHDYDNLWIVIDTENITFEEILQDFDIYNDCVKTQVIHLQYTLNAPMPLITHIDHEYVFYTIEEFENRLSDCTQKGNAIKRYKTFKIDNSEIPFESNNHFLLYDILEKYFTRTELLNEYFENVLKT